MTNRVCGDSRHVSGGRDSWGRTIPEALARRFCPPRLDVSGQLRGIDVLLLARSQDPAATRRADRLLQTLGIEVMIRYRLSSRDSLAGIPGLRARFGSPSGAEFRGHVRLRVGGVGEPAAVVRWSGLLGTDVLVAVSV